MNKKSYLGDGVYAEQNGLDLILTTENGFAVTNKIILEPHVLNALCLYMGLERGLRIKSGAGAIGSVEGVSMEAPLPSDSVGDVVMDDPPLINKG